MSADDKAALESRLACIEARTAIADLALRYCHLLDGRQFAGVAELFTDDAVFGYPGGSVQGRDALAPFFEAQLSRYEAWWHYPHGHLVELLGDGSAAGVVDAHAEHAEDGTCVIAGIRYDDRYRREGEDWRFAERTLQLRYFLPWEKLQGRYRHNPGFPPVPLPGGRA